MGFLSGSVTYKRFRIVTDPTGEFGDEHIKILAKNKIGKTHTNLYEAPTMGFTGGAHLLDTQFDLEKNIIGEALHFGVRIDSCQIPSPIKKAWTNIELLGVTEDNPGGRPTKSQREQAKEAVEARCIQEASDGNFRRMAETSVLWDAATGTIYVGSTSEKTIDACLGLLEKSFGLEFAHVTSGRLAAEYADEAGENEALFSTSPTSFHPEGGNAIHWWNGMGENYDYLGNEFLIWLWWHFENQSDKIQLSDDSEVSGMFARSLSLDCPQGEHGKESISSDSPVALPEAALALRMGKLPRKAGLTLVREGFQYDLSLQSETFAFGSAKITPMDDADKSRDPLDRIESIRGLSETVDLLFEAFCTQRINKAWTGEQKKIIKWLRTEPRNARRKTAA